MQLPIILSPLRMSMLRCGARTLAELDRSLVRVAG